MENKKITFQELQQTLITLEMYEETYNKKLCKDLIKNNKVLILNVLVHQLNIWLNPWVQLFCFKVFGILS